MLFCVSVLVSPSVRSVHVGTYETAFFLEIAVSHSSVSAFTHYLFILLLVGTWIVGDSHLLWIRLTSQKFSGVKEHSVGFHYLEFI